MDANSALDGCAALGGQSLEDDLTTPSGSAQPYPVRAAPGARSRTDAALLRLARVMSVATIRAGNAHQPTLSPTQVRVLTMLAVADRPLSLNEVAQCLGSSASATSRVCARLVRESYVVRHSGPGAEIRLSLMPSGIAALTAVNKDRLTRLRTLIAAVPDEHRPNVTAAAEALAEASSGSADFW